MSRSISKSLLTANDVLTDGTTDLRTNMKLNTLGCKVLGPDGRFNGYVHFEIPLLKKKTYTNVIRQTLIGCVVGQLVRQGVRTSLFLSYTITLSNWLSVPLCLCLPRALCVVGELTKLGEQNILSTISWGRSKCVMDHIATMWNKKQTKNCQKGAPQLTFLWQLKNAAKS